MDLRSPKQPSRHRLAALKGTVRFLSVLLGSALLALPTAGQVAADAEERLRETLAESPKQHPRLFLGGEGIDPIRDRIESEPLLSGIWDSICRQADAMVDLAPVEREMVGRRRRAGDL